MFAHHSSPTRSHRPTARFERAWPVLGILIAVTVAVIMVSLPGTQRSVSAPTHRGPLTQNIRSARSHVVFDPVSRHMHGGVTPLSARAGEHTVASPAAESHVRAEPSYGAVP